MERVYRVRPLTSEDAPSWIRLRGRLWPDAAPASLAREAREYLASRTEGTPRLNGLPAAVFVAERRSGGIVGFLEGSLRAGADGCKTHPVGYLEGWYVVPEARRRGIGAALVRAVERWASAHGCREMASDALLANSEGQQAHRALGYVEVDRVVNYRRSLPRAPAR